MAKYYDIGREPKFASRKAENQRHINRAYILCRLLMAETLQVTKVDNSLARIQRTLYTIEDTLSDYVQAIQRNEKEAI